MKYLNESPLRSIEELQKKFVTFPLEQDLFTEKLKHDAESVQLQLVSAWSKPRNRVQLPEDFYKQQTLLYNDVLLLCQSGCVYKI